MVDYTLSKIYCLRNIKTNKIYIGATTRSLGKRLSEHKSLYRSGVKTRGKSYLLFNTKIDDVIIELLEEYPCNSKYDLHKRELYYIKMYECLNHNHPTRTTKEYYQDTKMALLLYYKNRDKINKHRNEKVKCDVCNCFISRSGLKLHNSTFKHKCRTAFKTYSI
jgi:hypothetical protein